MNFKQRRYKLQFRCRPPAFSRVKITTISDPAKEIALNQELSVLLAKGAIEPVDPISQPGGFYSTYFLVNMEKSCLNPSQSLTFIGVALDTVTMRAICSAPGRHPPASSPLQKGQVSGIYPVSRLLGKLTAASDPKLQRHRKIRVSQQCLSTLSPWRERSYMSRGVAMGASASSGPQASSGGPLLASQDLVLPAAQTLLRDALASPQQEGPLKTGTISTLRILHWGEAGSVVPSATRKQLQLQYPGKPSSE
ncbi:hypothetical protein NQZ68_035636 [Dissostichus eleginoides]|nr:hypothetical protein NQZ68_035636 [Dissostichus eleginoides]